jgi:hypothetical protein
MPRPRRGSELVFGGPRAGCEKQLQMPPHPPPPHEIRMSVACLHGLWLGHFARSFLRWARQIGRPLSTSYLAKIA